MQFFDDMIEKYGFGDGDSEPPGMRKYRSVYVRVLNALLEKLGSAYRAVAYNRPGMHNSCMILFCGKKAIAGKAKCQIEEGDLEIKKALSFEEVAEEEQFVQAVDIARELYLDELLQTETAIDEDGLKKTLREIATGKALERDDDK